MSERNITEDRTAQSRMVVLRHWFRSHQLTSCSREGSEMSAVAREPYLITPFPLGHHTVTCVTVFPKRDSEDGIMTENRIIATYEEIQLLEAVIVICRPVQSSRC